MTIQVSVYFVRPEFINSEEHSLDASHRQRSPVRNKLNIIALYFCIQERRGAKFWRDTFYRNEKLQTNIKKYFRCKLNWQLHTLNSIKRASSKIRSTQDELERTNLEMNWLKESKDGDRGTLLNKLDDCLLICDKVKPHLDTIVDDQLHSKLIIISCNWSIPL